MINFDPENYRLVKNILCDIKLVAFDFDGVFTDNSVYVAQDGSETVRCYRGDGIGLSKLKRMGIETVVISSEVNPVVKARSRKLGIRCVHGCEDKVNALKNILTQLNLTMKQTAFVGNDINDLECLKVVYLPIIVHDAHPEIHSFAKYRTVTSGGYGAVREICDLFEHVLTTS